MVIGIIAVLVALVLTALRGSVGSAKTAAERARLKTLTDSVGQRVAELAKVYLKPTDPTPPGFVFNPAPGTRDAVGGTRERARVIYQIDVMRAEFPQSFGDFLADSWTTDTNMPSARRSYVEFYNANFKPDATAWPGPDVNGNPDLHESTDRECRVPLHDPAL